MTILLQVLVKSEGVHVYRVDAPVKYFFEKNMGESAFFVAYARVALTDGIVTRMTGYSMQRNVFMPEIDKSQSRLIVKKAVIGMEWIV